MNGNDLLEHIESCERCQAKQDRINELTKKEEYNEVMLLVDEQIECYQTSGD